MSFLIHNKFFLSVVFAAVWIVFSPPSFAAVTKDKLFTDREHAVTKPSEDGEYVFTLYSQDPEIPFKKIHNWIIHVETKDGKPVEDARVFVFGGMPAHRHGFPTRPVAKNHLGNGAYLVEGIKFTMPGEWQMRFNIKHGTKNARVVYEFNLSH